MAECSDHVKHHPRYDAASLRVLLTIDEILGLPVREITLDEVYERQCGWFWNPPQLYFTSVDLLPGEVGYDRDGRYVVKAS